jgi:hypothetical protein
MYALLVPLARGEALPPDVFAAALLRRPAQPTSAAGMLLHLVFGLFWGLVAALYDARYDPVLGSQVAQGLVWGVAAFGVSLGGFLSLHLIPKPVDWRAWAGHFLNHLVFGFLLGATFLVRDLALA